VGCCMPFLTHGMGQSESTVDGQAPETPPEVELSRRRKDYLHRLGINKDKRYKVMQTSRNAANFGSFQTPTTSDIFETPTRIEWSEGEDSDIVASNVAFTGIDLQAQDQFRVNFLRKLSYSKVWVPQAQRPPKHQTVIIFDWDDTLLCTSFLNMRQDAQMPAVVERHLKDIEKAGKKTPGTGHATGPHLHYNQRHEWLGRIQLCQVGARAFACSTEGAGDISSHKVRATVSGPGQ